MSELAVRTGDSDNESAGRGHGHRTSLVAELPPGSFSIVMATGIVSTAALLIGLQWLAQALLVVNVLAFVVIASLFLARVVGHPARVKADFTAHARGPAYFTIVAGSCVLGSQFVVLMDVAALAAGLWILGAVLWLVTIYAFFAVATTLPEKPRIEVGLNGSWMLMVVATQSVSLLATLMAPAHTPFAPMLLGASVSLFLIGCILYMLLFSLILYRFLFFTFDPESLTPPYWINMGAVAITTLAGSLLILNSGSWGFLGEILPFLKGFTLLFWATATWWIPLLLVLGVWRHGLRRIPLRYELQYWSIVFPLGMYAVATARLSEAFRWPFLAPVVVAFGSAALLAWLAAFVGLLRLLGRRGRRAA